MTLEKIYNKWLSIQPLSEADQQNNRQKNEQRFVLQSVFNHGHRTKPPDS